MNAIMVQAQTPSLYVNIFTSSWAIGKQGKDLSKSIRWTSLLELKDATIWENSVQLNHHSFEQASSSVELGEGLKKEIKFWWIWVKAFSLSSFQKQKWAETIYKWSWINRKKGK